MGLYGGAFDPPHAAHRALIRQSLADLGLARLHLVPTGQAAHRPPTQPLSAGPHRLAMLRLMLETLSLEEKARICLDDQELLRDGPSYTAYTVEALFERYASSSLTQPGFELWLIVGADQWSQLPRWYQVDQWRHQVRVCVASRPEWEGSIHDASCPDHVLALPPMPYSATAIRHAVQKSATQLSPTALGLLPEIAHYIARHALYSPA